MRSRRRRIHWWFRIGQNNLFPFQSCSAEVKDESDRRSGNSQIIDHPAPFVIGDFRNNLRLNDYGIVGDQIRNVFEDWMTVPGDLWTTINRKLAEDDVALA